MQIIEKTYENAKSLGRSVSSRSIPVLLASLFLLSVTWVVPVAHAVHPLVMQEYSYELKLADTRWPESASGSVSLPGCVHCKQDRYQLGATTRFLVVNQPATYREFLVAVRSGKVTAVFISIDLTSGEVARATVMP
jgi:hypothetical protein